MKHFSNACLPGLAIGMMVVVAAAHGAPAARSSPPVQRCGWFENPTPANAWLTDKDGQWVIAAQGGHQAEGRWPDFSASRWVASNGSYGYGCACLHVRAHASTRHIERIHKARTRPLAVCRADATLVEPKP